MSQACDALSVCARYQSKYFWSWTWSILSSVVSTLSIILLSHFFWFSDPHSRYEPGIGYDWDFLASDETQEQHTTNLGRRRNRIRRILDTRPPGFERTEEEEEGIRASEAIERILFMLNDTL
jgi:hypothetical protein